MYVIRLPDGTLRVPHSVLAGSVTGTEAAGTDVAGDVAATEPTGAEEGLIIAQAYVELRPGDPDYERYLDGSVTEEEMAAKRRRWRDEDEDLARVFEEYKAGEEHKAGKSDD
ncbi:hypothetical protein [Actinomadura sp. 9N407]|uniref:hypothetical protein n=1 Tax=Actinomadura sp. 9N407 TaxID=3375154 RepID=UPI0037895CFE